MDQFACILHLHIRFMVKIRIFDLIMLYL